MPEIEDKYLFEPNHNARKAWLATRKKPYKYNRIEFPGLFQTIGYPSDTGWFWSAGFIELLAVALTISGGISRGGIFIGGAVLAIGFFLLFDYWGAKLFHKHRGDRCEIKNEILIETDTRTLEELRIKLNKFRFSKFSGAFLIILSSLLKMTALILLLRFDVIIYYAIFVVAYAVLIFIHFEHTGYFFAERSLGGTFKKQHRQWAQKKTTDNEARELNLAFNDPQELFKEDRLSAGKHTITKKKDDTGYSYDIETVGILTDRDIHNLIGNGQMNDEATGKIALNCLKHQIRNILP